MKLQLVLDQVISAIRKKDLKSAQQLLQSQEIIYGNNPYFLWQKAIYELSNDSDKKNIVLPLMEKAYKGGLKELNFLRQFGSLLIEFDNYATACKVFGNIIRIKRDDIEAYIKLADIFSRTGNPVTAINTLELAAKINPTHSSIPTIYYNIANALMESGYQCESIEAYKKALEIDSKNDVYLSHFLFYLNYVDISREKYFLFCHESRTYWENNDFNARQPFPQTEKINIGFLSGDFRFHAVSFFTGTLFENYDKNRFEIHLFSTQRRERYDRVTEILIKQTDKWHDVSKTGLQETIDIIKNEKISVLIDLAGHTNAGIPLKIFGYRPAPVQVSYCGYPNTTGLKSIDYRITDGICEPDDAQNYHSEKLFKMDGCFLCYQPYYEAIPECSFVNPCGRPIIFGSFNNLSKITPKTIKLWCDVINTVPNSKIVLKYKYLNDPKLREIIISRFAQYGLSNDRIVTFSFDFEIREHYAKYNKIDIALDTFPYNGTTTTCDALYMGVPVITILGDRHASRVSASLLNAVGLGELVAKDEKEFVEIAANLAGAPKKLTGIKRNLREMMQNSPLMDKKSFIKKWQDAILDMISETKHELSN